MTQTREEIEKFIENVQEEGRNWEELKYPDSDLSKCLKIIRQLLKENDSLKEHLIKYPNPPKKKETEPNSLVSFAEDLASKQKPISDFFPPGSLKRQISSEELYENTWAEADSSLKETEPKTSIPQQEWRPMSNPPEDGARVLVKTKHGIIEADWDEKEGVFNAYFWANICFFGDGWLPLSALPQPPKGE